MVDGKKRILIVKMSSLGDLFHALPAVHILKRNLKAVVDWVVQPEYAHLAKCFDDVHEMIVYPRKDFIPKFIPFWRSLRTGRYDYIIDLQGLLKSALVTRLARGGQRIGLSFSREGARLFYDAVAGKKDKHRHAVDEVLDIVRYMGFDDAEKLFPVTFPEYPAEGSRPCVAFAPCSRWPAKNWPPDQFIETGRALREKRGGSIFLVGGADDGDVCRRIARGIGGGTVDLSGKTTLVELGGLLRKMDLILTVDSGPMHMAAAVGKPVLALFGATDPLRTGPYGPMHRVITSDGIGVHSDMARAYKRGALGTMTMAVDDVVDCAVEMLG